MTLKQAFGSSLARLLCGVGLMTAMAPSAIGQPMRDPAQAPVAGPASPQSRFAVALQLPGSWCYGYLYASQDKIRFEVVQPQSDGRYSFDLPRSEVAVRQWVLLGVPQAAIELQTKSATYHLRWLGYPAEVNTGPARRWAPPISQPPDGLIAAVQNPAASAVPGSSIASGGGASGSPAMGGGPATVSEDGPKDMPPGMLAGVYVATAGQDMRPTTRQYLFYPDGFVMQSVPQEGMLGFDFSHLRRGDNPDKFVWVGRYRVDGEEIKILWMNQYADPANPDIIRRNETSAHPPVQVGPMVFIPMCRCTGKRLSGTYRWGAPAADQYLQFFPDGTFIDHRVTDQLIVPSRFYEHPRIQRGTYDIERQTILFTFADGHRGTRTFLAPKVQANNPTFDWIDLGWQMLFEEGYRARLSRGW